MVATRDLPGRSARAGDPPKSSYSRILLFELALGLKSLPFQAAVKAVFALVCQQEARVKFDKEWLEYAAKSRTCWRLRG